eukprot:s3086_g8.t1
MTRAIFELLSLSKLDNAKRRLDTLKLWRQWADELAVDESVIKEQMPPHVKGIMINKRLALLERVANRCLDWPDKRLHQEMREGFKIVGEAPATGVFRLQPKTGSMSESELMEQSKFLRPAIIGKTKNAGSGLHTKELFDITLTEATEKKWLQGPYCYEEVTQLLGRSWLPVRRFCVEQRGKLRPIDDFCENKLNNAFTTVDKISLRTMDYVVWAALIICKHCLHNHHMDFVLKDGERLRGPVHEDWHGASSMKATALDLKSAYKQLPLNADDVNKAVVTVFDEEKGEPSFFLMHTLPFGASASVLHFNRVGNLLWAAGCKLGLVWASYFDDYPVLCPDGLEQSSVGAAKAMLGLFGFDYAGDKLQEPDFHAELLGVELDLSLSSKGSVQVGNKKDRVLEIGAALGKILADRSIRPKDIPSHLGRLQYADMQVAGRAGRLAMYDIRQLGTAGNVPVSLSDSAVSALKILKERITSGKPKRLTARPASKPWLLFTDGALEYEECGNAIASIGAVLISPSGNTWYFGCEVPKDTLSSWQAGGKEHVIGLVELYATVVALTEWKGLIRGQRIILFIDNYGAQDCLVKGSASVDTWRRLLLLLEELDCEMFSNMWVTRVASSSNPADFPSRGSVKELEFLQPMETCVPRCPILHCDMKDLC